MSKHTPGPWKWVEIGIEDEEALVPDSYQTGDDVVLTLGWVSCGDGTRGTEPSPEDARLIAAAPDLLEALKLCVQRMEELQEVTNFPIAWPRVAAEEAIARSWLTKQEGDYPMKPYQIPPNITVEITYSELDGTPVIQILTEDSPENAAGPICRVYLNDGSLFENPAYPIHVSSEHTPSEPATDETEHRP